jgi:uncharacterized membrane protein
LEAVRSKRGRWLAALGLVAAFAVGARAIDLGSQPFWLDEACTSEFNAGTVASVVTAYARDVHPPLYGLLLHGWQAVLGDSEEALRGYSVLWSVVGLVFAALLTLDVTGSRSAALVAGLLVAVNPFDIWYAQEARMYAQAAALAAIAAWVLWHWLQTGEPMKSRWPFPIAYAVLASMLLYTHYVTAVVVASQGLVVLAIFAIERRWSDAFRLTGSVSAAAVLFLPWIAFVHRFRETLYSPGNVGWIPKPQLAEVFGYLNHEFFLGFAVARGAAAGWFSVVVAVVLAVVVAAASERRSGSNGHSPRSARRALLFALGLAIVPTILATAISESWHPIYFRLRFSLFCLIPTVLALVVLLMRIQVPLRTLLTAVIAALMVTGATWQATSPIKQGLPELKRLAQLFGEPEFVVLFPPPHGLLVHYYLPDAKLQPSRSVLAARMRGGTATTMWVGFKDGVIPPPGSPDGDLVAWLAARGPHRVLGAADGFKVFELRAPPHSAGFGNTMTNARHRAASR